MSRILPAAVTALLFLTLFCTAAEAQDFRIYTRLYDHSMTPAADQPRERIPVASRSLTLFHAGKVYDWISEIGEVIIFDPSHRRFLILNTSRKISTTVEFEQLRQMLKIASEVARERVDELRNDSNGLTEAAAAIEFQLTPQFAEKIEGDGQRLSLTSGFLQYRAQCAKAPEPEIGAAYYDYADWMCRLNYVLHPQTLLPGPRLMLNQSLRQQGLLPTDVELRTEFEPRLHFEAEHTIHWKLDTSDRSLIHLWESRLRSDDVRQLSFRDYQRTVLGTTAEQ
ncbi:MAG: hypothetical protein KDA79_16220 [Planctomycetaceae bacterium]|nr:hypothetical protein [Planctomycetaceae bacterium]